MKKKTLWKDIKKCFLKSKGRFFSILCLVALGSFALVGLKVSGPDMRKTGENYFNSLNLADISIIGDLGIDEQNIEAINKISGAENIEYGYLKDVVIKNTDDSIRIFSRTNIVSGYEVTEGRLPVAEDEIAIASFYSDRYSLGNTISFSEKEDVSGETVLKKHDFKITGFVNSSELMSIINMGQSTSGTGELSGYAVVLPDAFDSDVYMIARISYADTKGVDPYSSEYTALIQTHKEELETLLKDQPRLRLAAVKSEYQEKIDDAEDEVQEAKNKLADALSELNNGESSLADAKASYQSGLKEYMAQKNEAQEKLTNVANDLADADKQLTSAETELDANKTALSESEAELAEAREALDLKWAEYNENVVRLETLKQMYAQLQQAQTELDAQISEAETQTGMSIDEIEAALPQMKADIDSSKAQYQAIASLKELRDKRDAAAGTEEYEGLAQAYAEALAAAGMSEEEAEVAYAQMDGMAQSISEAEAQYQKLSALVQAKHELEKKLAQYNAMASQNEGAEEQLAQTKIELDKAEEEYSQKEAELMQAKETIAEYEAELNSKRQEYEQNLNAYIEAKQQTEEALAEAEAELRSAASSISSAETTLADGWAEYNKEKPDADAEIADAKEKIKEAQDLLNSLKAPVYSTDTRRETPGAEGYKIYKSVSDIVDSLAGIFPIFLYFVAALVTLTTMTRFVDEERINSGTLKALGYNDADIIKKFTLYGFSASTIGALIGIFAGHTLLPMIVYNAYGKSFTYPEIELHFYPGISAAALVLAFLSAVVPAYLVAKDELKEKPAQLLQPKAPGSGSKILMEKIPFIWNRLNFTHKVTARNIFRYKKRMLMTIFGVCGSVTLIFAGFSVQHSVSGINERQFGHIMKYDLIVAESDSITTKQREEINKLLLSEKIENQTDIHYESVTKVAGQNSDKQEIKLIAAKDGETLSEYVTLAERTSQQAIDLSDDGCVISERLAKLLGVKKGDAFEFSDSENIKREVYVSDITEMYTGHFIFMNSAYYQKVFGEKYDTNAILITLKDRSSESAKQEASRFMELEGVKGVVQNTTMTNQIETIVTSLNKIMDILIIVAMLLAVVILYNLTNINVSERIRELSTIKVLGFYNKEVTLYIYRETILLTILGILVGFGFGDMLFRYIINVVPPDEVMFSPALGAKAFVIPTVTVALITFILGISVNRRLKNVDMMEALKSVE